MNWKNGLAIMAISASTALLSVWGYGRFVEYQQAGEQEAGKLPVNYAGFFGNTVGTGNADFTAAATSATPAVVHIKTRTKAKQVSSSQQRQRSPFSDFFGDDFGDFFGGGPRIQPEQRASGSGVLITQDGYIVTNNHVIDGADEINVTLANKKSYKATLIGQDPNSDLAVIKIEGKTFPYMIYGNSDDAKLGQWVLAIGYPFSLDVTVTAGIISAKSRSIGINSRQANNPVESFIQTDAAVNPGNSGGALVNTNGELIGINSAIASPTGSYAGYSYAIPVNMVKKIVTDIVKFGTVQRAYIGIEFFPEILTESDEKGLDAKYGSKWRTTEGVFITNVLAGGAADVAGLKAEDILIKLNGVPITSNSELQEQISRYKPGDKITVTYKRAGKETVANVTLKNKAGNTDVVKNSSVMEKLGGELVNLDKKIAAANEVTGGVVVKKVGNGLLSKSRMEDGFVITGVNGKDINNIEELKAALSSIKNGNIRLDGFYPGFEGRYTYPLKLNDE